LTHTVDINNNMLNKTTIKLCSHFCYFPLHHIMQLYENIFVCAKVTFYYLTNSAKCVLLETVRMFHGVKVSPPLKLNGYNDIHIDRQPHKYTMHEQNIP